MQNRDLFDIGMGGSFSGAPDILIAGKMQNRSRLHLEISSPNIDFKNNAHAQDGSLETVVGTFDHGNMIPKTIGLVNIGSQIEYLDTPSKKIST